MQEVRAQQLDLAARSKFVPAGDIVEETRAHIAEPVKQKSKGSTAKTARWLQVAAKNNFIEVG